MTCPDWHGTAPAPTLLVSHCGVRIWAGVQLRANPVPVLAANWPMACIPWHSKSLTGHRGCCIPCSISQPLNCCAGVAGSGRECSFELTERLSWLRIGQGLAGALLFLWAPQLVHSLAFRLGTGSLTFALLSLLILLFLVARYDRPPALKTDTTSQTLCHWATHRCSRLEKGFCCYTAWPSGWGLAGWPWPCCPSPSSSSWWPGAVPDLQTQCPRATPRCR